MTKLEALEEIRDLIIQLPGGIDTEARPEDLSPRDATQYIGGLIWQICNTALGEPSE